MMEPIIAIEPETASLLVRLEYFLKTRNTQAYLVGGFVRDIITGRRAADTADIDIAVSGNALETAGDVARALDGRYITLDEINQVGRVVLSGDSWELDFSTVRGDIAHDLSLRDFTIDALAIPLGTVGEPISRSLVIDPSGGLDDLDARLIRAVGESVFQADPARLLRAVRLAAELEFVIEPHTESLVRFNAGLIRQVPGERVREEMLRILAVPAAGDFIAYLDELGILTELIPELGNAKGVEQPVVHYWDVFRHSLETVSAVIFLLRESRYRYAGEDVLALVPWSVRLKGHFDEEVSHGSTRRSMLKAAALLHDIAKPQTKSVDEDGRTRFLGHSDEGALAAAEILSRLRFSAREIKLVELLVKYHLRPGQMNHDGLPTGRAIYRYFRDTGPSGIDVLFLSLADHLAARGPSLDMSEWKRHTGLTRYVLERYFEEESRPTTVKLIDGHDLISTFDLREGPFIGRVLEAVREAQAEGEIKTKEDALAYVKHLLAKERSNSWEKNA